MDQILVSDSNRTPLVQIVTWLCVVTSVLAFFTNVGIKIYISRSLSAESGLVFTSLIFCVAQSIAVSLQTVNGYGKPSNSLNEYQISASLKGQYAATILFLLSLGFSKIGVAIFIRSLTPQKSIRNWSFGLIIFSLLWMLSSVLVSAFRCKLPRPWDLPSRNCINGVAWWQSVIVLNIISELAIVALQLLTVAPLHIKKSRKAAIIGLFTCRLLVSIAAAIQLYYFCEDSGSNLQSDFTLGYWRSALCNQVVQCLAVITPSLPYVKLYMDSCESGLNRVDDLRRRGLLSSGDDDNRAYKLLDVARGKPQEQNQIRRTTSFTVGVTDSDGQSTDRGNYYLQ